MATWWKVGRSGQESAEAVKETEHTLTINRWGRERRVNKVSDWERWYPTEAEAIGAIVKRAVAAQMHARQALEEAERKVATLRERYPDAPEWNG